MKQHVVYMYSSISINPPPCLFARGCATESQCHTESGALMEGDTQTVGALAVQTWCALAENSEDYSLLSLRTPVNGEDRNVREPGRGRGEGGGGLIRRWERKQIRY